MLFRTFTPPGSVKLRPRSQEPRLRPWFPPLVKMVARPYLRSVGYDRLVLEGTDEANRLWADFYKGRIRLIVAFRHPYGNDPQVLTAAVVRGIRPEGFQRTSFLQFVHGAEVGWWAGALARWALPRAGGLAVNHGSLGPGQLKAIRQAILSGPHPVALAPEGQVTYSARVIQRVEPGFARLGFLAAEDLEARGEGCRVVVLPVSLHQMYPTGTAKRLPKVLAKMEKFVFGRPAEGIPGERLNRLRDGIFSRVESWYAENHGGTGPSAPWDQSRLVPLLETALTAGESLLGLPHEGDFFFRLYRVRAVGWERIYPEKKHWEDLSPLDRRLTYRSLTEAWAAFRHMELADLAWYLGGDGPDGQSDPGVLADYAENLQDLLGRVTGGNISHRRQLFPRGIRVIFGEGIDLTARLGQYHLDKKAAVADTVAELIRIWRKSAPGENDGRR